MITEVFTKEQRKRLIELYPYLQPTNIWTGEIPGGFDYDYVRGEGEIPEGWRRLFFMYCKAIRDPLIKANMLDKFKFSDIKEKYGTLRLYNMGYPENIGHITTLYEGFSQYVCENCGERASVVSYGWITSLCDRCWSDYPIDCPCDFLSKAKWAKVEIWDSKIKSLIGIYYSYKSLIKEYDKIKNLTNEEFYNYLIAIE